MNRWVLGIAAVLLLLLFVVVAGGAAFYFLYYKPRHDAGPLVAEALHLPADVGVVGGVDLEKVFATPLFTLAKGQDSVAAGLKEVQEKIGVDVEKDLRSVAFGSWMDPAKANEGVALLSGQFTLDRLKQALEKEGKTRQDISGIPAYGLDAETSVAFVSESLIVLGAKGRLTTFLANRAAGRRPLGDHTLLMENIRRIPKETTLWVQVAEPALLQLQKATAEGGPAGLKPPALKSLAVTADVSPGLTLAIAARPRREQDAEEFGKQLEAALTMASAFAGDSPDNKKILEGVKVSRGAGEVKVTLTASWDVIGKAFVTPLLAARVSANEAAAIGNVRTMISAQVTYQAVTGGQAFGTVECLKSPASCVSGYTGPSFVDESYVCPGEKNGYSYELVLSPGKDAFAVTAVPAKIGETGKRSFCGDYQGIVCEFADGRVPSAAGGQCPSDCSPVS